jgi:hypothetical protein
MFAQARRSKKALEGIKLDLADHDVFLTRPEAAKYLHKSIPTLERWHKLGTGPRSVLCGKLRLYPLTGLREFLGQGA